MGSRDGIYTHDYVPRFTKVDLHYEQTTNKQTVLITSSSQAQDTRYLMIHKVLTTACPGGAGSGNHGLGTTLSPWISLMLSKGPYSHLSHLYQETAHFISIFINDPDSQGLSNAMPEKLYKKPKCR